VELPCGNQVKCQAEPGTATLKERCSDGVEDQGAEEASMGHVKRESCFVSFGSRPPCERLSFQLRTWNPGGRSLGDPSSPTLAV